VRHQHWFTLNNSHRIFEVQTHFGEFGKTATVGDLVLIVLERGSAGSDVAWPLQQDVQVDVRHINISGCECLVR